MTTTVLFSYIYMIESSNIILTFYQQFFLFIAIYYLSKNPCTITFYIN